MTVLVDKLAYLVNPVLLELGGKALSTLSSTSSNKTEQMCALTLDQYVTQVLNIEPWACVSKRDTALTASSGVTSDEFDYVYDLPTDFVRMVGEPMYSGVSLHYSDAPQPAWRIRGRYLECAYSHPDIFYVYKPIASELEDSDTDDYFSTDMDASLRAAIQAICKWKWCYQVTGDLKTEASYMNQYQIILRMAKAENIPKLGRLIANRGERPEYVKFLGVR